MWFYAILFCHCSSIEVCQFFVTKASVCHDGALALAMDYCKIDPEPFPTVLLNPGLIVRAVGNPTSLLES